MRVEALHDVVVIGAGAAGVSAAIECFDVKLDVVVLESASKVGGQIEQIPHAVRNVAPAADGNEALIGALARHAATLGNRLQLDQTVTQLDLAAGLIDTGTHRYRARSVLVATGSRRREFENTPDGSFGGDVTYVVEPHLARFASRPMAVVGGGDSAVLDALQLAALGSPVTLIYRSPQLTARRDLVERVRADDHITEMAGWTLDGLVGSDRLQGVDVADPSTGEHRRLDVSGAVLKLGREQRVDLVRDQLALGIRGGIVVNADLRTSDQRTFAAGDVVEGAYERIATAVGQGSLAARSILGASRVLPMKGSGLPAVATILHVLLDPTTNSRQHPDAGLGEVMDAILALHRGNALQWDREDDARKNVVDDAMVAAAKRDIDQLNSVRHGLIEVIDRAILCAIPPCEGAPLVTESPGMAIDRLSVLVIRLASTEARTASGTDGAARHAERLPRLQNQLLALEEAIATLFDDLGNGTRRFLAHESLKLYGPQDP